jgi:hypothetical protein
MSHVTSASATRRAVGASVLAGGRADEHAARRARLTVPPRLRVPTPRFPFVTLVTMIMVGGVVGLLLFNTSMQQASFTATALEGEAQALSEREQTLQMELEELRDPQRLAEAARAQGMVPVSRPAFLRMKDGKLLGDPAPAVAADQLSIDAPPVQRPAAANPPPTVVEAPDTSLRDDPQSDPQGASTG